ncbi:MAG: family 20 glycosylhydrolase [Clostridiales bacterium]|nr:family 20 glycosylhydrolase [Clostridiales bacterium]
MLATTARTIADYRTIPLPHNITTYDSEQPFTLGADVEIEATPALKNEARFMREFLPEGLKGESSGKIILRSDLVDSNPEAYMITVDKDAVTVNGATAAGTFYGVQTLRKALAAGPDIDGTMALPAGQIFDKPRFSYRGTHFDVSRHFFTVDEVKSFIDMIALHGVNKFHWHLTDDQGWRIQIDKYPKLTEIGSYRPHSIIGHAGPDYDNIPVSGFYTKEQAREIIKYAAERHIDVIPEIDLPGHMMAAMASYPQLGCKGGPYEVWCSWGVNDGVLCPGKDETMQFIADVMNEVMDLFPSQYIHIGGDECPKVEWAKCPACQARIKELGIEAKEGMSAETQLQGYVTSFACNVAKEHGKTPIGWDEILECDIPQDAVIMSWRGVEGAADGTRRGHRAILTPNSCCYFDFYQDGDTDNEPYAIGGLTTVEQVYALEPCLPTMSDEQKNMVLGCQANLWTEYIPTFDYVQYMELPRLAALSEVQWLNPSQKDYADFKTRIPALLTIYDRMGYRYARHIADVAARYEVDSDNGALKVTASALPGYQIRYTLDGADPTVDSPLYGSPLSLKDDCIINITTFKNGTKGRQITDTLKVGKLTFAKCTLETDPDAGYFFNGAQQLVDGFTGGDNYRSGKWLGFSGRNCDATIQPASPTELSEVSFNINVTPADGLLDCRSVEVYGQKAGASDWTLLAAEEYPEATPDVANGIVNHTIKFEPITLEKVRVLIKPHWVLPKWHRLNYCLGFIFVDEISAK